MSQPISNDDDDVAPGEARTSDYQATEGRRGGGRGEFLWFVTADGKRDQVFPIADIRRMEPPSDPDKEVAWIHFSGVTVALAGRNLRRVLNRITLNRCSALYEFRRGQRKPAEDEPFIEHMAFADVTKSRAKGEREAEESH